MKKTALLIISVLTVILFTGCSKSSDPDPAKESKAGSWQQITQQQAYELMQKETDYIILDVRTPEEFAQGHIPDAINIPNETIGTDRPQQLQDLDQMILVYCRSGNRSKQASEKLAKMGYTNVLEFGGINTWPYETVKD